VTAAGMPDRFMTVVGQVYRIALKYPTGKVTRTGNTMFSLTSGLVAFFPPAVAQEIDSLHLSPGEPFTVCHRGGERWDIERSGNGGGAVPPAPVSGKDVQFQSPHPTPAAPAPVNGQGRTHADMYVECFRDAVRIAPELMAIAKAQGFQISPSFEDIRCMATHFSIAREQR
jgi:hypothetical protein